MKFLCSLESACKSLRIKLSDKNRSVKLSVIAVRIWAAVPQTALIAWACTEFLYTLWREKSVRNVAATLILAGIVFLSGNPVSEWTGTQLTQVEAPRETLRQLSEYHLEESGETELHLWAPKDISMSFT